ncbi:hypothetical protein ACFOSV_11420 [Algoriphagus namhaensis]|uniref:IrrE N-terminal-like domain-containing protein n=1 Tax=Algoriphagus namhaensis TaxID=915353 RepID=A0ABV8AU35_9BACT
MNNNLDKILSFIVEIGITLSEEKLEDGTFLPGLKIDRGVIILDREKLLYPGDVLHEAGHIALMTAQERRTIVGNVKAFRSPMQDDEMGVMAWSFAAAKHLEIPAKEVFHDGGYKGEADYLLQEYETGQVRGLPLLVWMNLTSYECYPKMKRWVRED